MVDAPNNDFEPQPPMTPVVPESRPGFLASTTGKLVLGGAALLVVLIIVGVIAWVFLFNTPSSQVGQVTTRVVNPSGSVITSGSPVTGTDPVTEPQEKPLESTFTFRNVFAPTLKEPTPAAVVASITAPPVATGDDSAELVKSVPKDTLYLVSIQTVDGKKAATFIWNGALYSLGEGDTLSGTPWKVVEIGESSVVMLYGDTQVTLSTGQGLSK